MLNQDRKILKWVQSISIAVLITISYGNLMFIAQASPILKRQSDSRGAEAKSNLGTMIRAQQAFFLESKRFAADIKQLDARIDGKFYDYKILKAGIRYVFMTATPKVQGLKPYIAGGTYQKNPEIYFRIICEGQQVGKTIAYPIFTGNVLKCGKGTTLIE